MFERAAVLQISRDSGSPQGMAAGGIGETSGLDPALDHVQHIKPGHRPVILARAAEERPLFTPSDSGRRNRDIQILLETRTARHLLALAAFFMQSDHQRLRCWK